MWTLAFLVMRSPDLIKARRPYYRQTSSTEPLQLVRRYFQKPNVSPDLPTSQLNLAKKSTWTYNRFTELPPANDKVKPAE